MNKNARKLVIAGREITDDTDAYVIAEVGHNHQGNLETAKRMFKAAKESGADAVKLQKRDNKSLYTRKVYDQAYVSENSYGPTYGLHREALEFGKSEFEELKSYARELDIHFFATAFDFASVDFLMDLGIPAFKIASGDLKNTPLLSYVAQAGKPLIISTGGATLADVHRAYETVMPLNGQICFLQCTAAYPAEAEVLNLRVIETYRREFPGSVIGLSDHQNGISMSVVAYTLGARVIEKHFTLNRAMRGTDHAFSLEPTGMHKLVRDLRRARLALGSGEKQMLPCESAPLLKMGKQLVAVRDLGVGHKLKREDISIKSPAGGLPPYELDRVLGKTLLRPIGEDEKIILEDLDLIDDSLKGMDVGEILAETETTEEEQSSNLTNSTALPVRSSLPSRPGEFAPLDALRISSDIEAKIRALKLVVFDFDGVFTDNMVYVGEDGKESVRCSRADGIGLQRLEKLGIKACIISTETNPVVGARAGKLRIDCRQGCDDKKKVLNTMREELGLTLDEIAFVGNDVNDLGCLSMVGLPIAVADAHPDAALISIIRTEAEGGHGAVREICDFVSDVLEVNRRGQGTGESQVQ